MLEQQTLQQLSQLGTGALMVVALYVVYQIIRVLRNGHGKNENGNGYSRRDSKSYETEIALLKKDIEEIKDNHLHDIKKRMESQEKMLIKIMVKLGIAE